MTDRVRIAVHHQKRVLSPRDHQMRGVIARLCRLGEKIEIARFFFEILHPPRSPQCLQFFFRKFFRRHLQFGFPVGEADSLPCRESRFMRRKVESVFGPSPLSFRAKSRNLWIEQPYGGTIMRRIIFLLLTSFATGRLLAADQPQSEDELTKLKRDYADVLALEGTSKREILAIARILRAKPEIAIDQTAASGEYCLNSGLGTMVHFATQPERTPEDVVYEFDASELSAAGLDTSRMQQVPARGRMTPGLVYFPSKGHQHP